MSENNKTKKILFIILAVAVIVALGLVVYQYSGYRAETKVQEGAGTEEGAGKILASPGETTQAQEEIAKIINEAIDVQDMSLCEKIKAEDLKRTCKTNVIAAKARTKDDPAICDQIEEEYNRTVCKDSVIIYKALDSGDLTICERLIDKTKVEDCKREASYRGEK